jgi:phytoene synthase
MTSFNGLGAAELEEHAHGSNGRGPAASRGRRSVPIRRGDPIRALPRSPARRRRRRRSGHVAAPVSLGDSRAYCEQLTKAQARNFYYGLKLLPEPKRSDMFALYAYMRLIDDIADEDERARSCAQRSGRPRGRGAVVTRAVLDGDDRFAAGAGHEVWPAFADMARRHRLPGQLFDDVIAGQLQDLNPAAFRDVRPAPPVLLPRRRHGRIGEHLRLGLRRPRGHAPARRSTAASRSSSRTSSATSARTPPAAAPTSPPTTSPPPGVTPADLRAGRGGEPFLALMRQQIARAESYYARSAELESRIAPDSRPTLVAMTQIYHGLLRKLAADPSASCASGCRSRCSRRC